MAGTYWIGFEDAKTSEDEALKAAMATIRDEGDADQVTAGPEVVRTEDGDAEGRFQVRVVTGIPDPRVEAERKAAAVDAAVAGEQAVLARLAALTPDHLDALDQLVELVAERKAGP